MFDLRDPDGSVSSVASVFCIKLEVNTNCASQSA